MGENALKILLKNAFDIKRDNLGRILEIEVKIDDSVFVLISIYNASTESEQLHTLNDVNRRCSKQKCCIRCWL